MDNLAKVMDNLAKIVDNLAKIMDNSVKITAKMDRFTVKILTRMAKAVKMATVRRMAKRLCSQLRPFNLFTTRRIYTQGTAYMYIERRNQIKFNDMCRGIYFTYRSFATPSPL